MVLAGAQATEVEKMDLNHPESLHLKNLSFKNVIRPGFITDEEANLIMNLAVCTVQPSFYEGFGLSVIHAFASGCPVIASKTQALVEIGGDACVYFDPNNSNELAEKIDMFANNEKLRQMFIEKGSERVKMFSWKKTAEETLKVYE